MSRIVLDPEIRAVVDQIQAKTKTTSPSAAITLIVTRYARHLLETWEVDPARYIDPSPLPYIPAARPHPEFKFSDPIEGI